MRRMYTTQGIQKLIDDSIKEAFENIDDLDVGGDLNVVKDINSNGEISGSSIIEKMTGYSAVASTSDLNWNPIYVGACKNGNKLTFVVFGSFTKSGTISDSANPLTFTIPSDVGAKLTPYIVGGFNVLESKKIPAMDESDFSADGGDIYAGLIKTSDTSIFLRMENMNSLTDGTYYFRYEATFLLSHTLIS